MTKATKDYRIPRKDVYSWRLDVGRLDSDLAELTFLVHADDIERMIRELAGPPRA